MCVIGIECDDDGEIDDDEIECGVDDDVGWWDE